jgi:hypothetical protein
MPRIVSDPNLQICPDFDSDDFLGIRESIAEAANITPDQAALNLAASWSAQNNTKIAAWVAQLEADELLEDAAALAAAQAEAAAQAQLEKEAADELREAEKKKPKMHTFDVTKSIGTNITQRPSAYALERLRKFEYVELWYFTPEGCNEAALTQRSAADDTFGITRTDSDLMVLKPVATVRASRKAVKDEDLTWDQMEVGSTLMLRNQRQLHWPEPATDALSIFWYKLYAHELRSQPDGQRILLIYLARARREWHAALERKDTGFNIGFIDEDLLAKITREVFHMDHQASLREVSPSFFPSSCTAPHLAACTAPSVLLRTVPCSLHGGSVSSASLRTVPCSLHGGSASSRFALHRALQSARWHCFLPLRFALHRALQSARWHCFLPLRFAPCLAVCTVALLPPASLRTVPCSLHGGTASSCFASHRALQSARWLRFFRFASHRALQSARWPRFLPLRSAPCLAVCTVAPLLLLRFAPCLAVRTASAASLRTSHLPSPLQVRSRPRSSPPRGRYSAPQGRGRRSRSRSPPSRLRQRSPRYRSPPPPRKGQTSQQVFQGGASSAGPSACTLCLGRFRHDTTHCKATLLWDRSQLHCHRNDLGRLVNPTGLVLCSDWQLPRSCLNPSHPDRHECSGCGNKSHGAQGCPRSQKN